MRPILRVLPFLTIVTMGACPKPGTQTQIAEPLIEPHGQLADEVLYRPTYGKAELQRALITERGAEAQGEATVGELEAKEGHDDRLRFAQADLEVRRRFIASLEACETAGRFCPPRLDDPPWAFDPDPDVQQPPKLDTPLRFDLASWQKVAAELHGRACACRTMSCIDSMTVAIEQLETRPMPEVQGDETATQSITWARECLLRLRGKKPTRVATPVADE
ncbi:MAG: hypothetical protein AB7T06_40850 [Kofleriaceae bacterium]